MEDRRPHPSARKVFPQPSQNGNTRSTHHFFA